ncbi:MAG: L-ribulose-5-phosphate 4-epimerase [Candidatus Glassbacteria bacterium]|nr:L-ribulose-5-phosphate 4-epimerase [Candidatus Glassbacteria bacterium]
MLKELKERVLEANLELWRRGLIIHTWGNVSGIDRERGLVLIKPSGVPYEKLTVEKLAIVDLEGNPVTSEYKASSDTPTHLELYRSFPATGAVAHSHSRYATAWAQAKRAIPALGTTHADYFHGEIPLTRALTAREIESAYELETGRVIVERFAELDPGRTPGVLVYSHGPFTWGADPESAVENMAVLEEVAQMAWATMALAPDTEPMAPELLDKHYLRKHGGKSYYGQD